MVWLKRIGMVVAVAAFLLSFVNASWIAPAPEGGLRLVATAGPACAKGRGTPATGLAAIERVFQLGADYALVDVARDAAGRFTASLRPANGCPEAAPGTTALLADVVRALPRRQFIFAVEGAAGDGDALVDTLQATGLPLDRRYAFEGAGPALARISERLPGAWILDRAAMQACAADYLKLGWTSHVPASCAGGTVRVALDRQWTVWGWPNRFQQRMGDAGTRILLGGPEGSPADGLTALEQIGNVPRSFKGFLLVSDIEAIGPAIQR